MSIIGIYIICLLYAQSSSKYVLNMISLFLNPYKVRTIVTSILQMNFTDKLTEEETLSNLLKIIQLGKRPRIYSRNFGFRVCAGKRHPILFIMSNVKKILERSVLKQNLLKRQIKLMFITHNKTFNALFCNSTLKMTHRIKAAYKSVFTLFFPF